MKKPIALQLYTLREALAQDFVGVVKQVAASGYAGVETAGFPSGTTPQTASQLFRDLGLTVASAHSPLPLGNQQQEVLDTLATLGCSRLVCGYIPASEFDTVDQIRRTCDRLNEAYAVCQAHGLSLGYHNHWWEMYQINGRFAYQLMLEQLHPDIFLEIDTYWVKTGGLDPVTVLTEVGSRAPLLHIKDGPADDPQAPMTAVGQGVLNFPAILAAHNAHTEWLIIELDRCATDMMTAVQESYQYLAGL